MRVRVVVGAGVMGAWTARWLRRARATRSRSSTGTARGTRSAPRATPRGSPGAATARTGTTRSGSAGRSEQWRELERESRSSSCSCRPAWSGSPTSARRSRRTRCVSLTELGHPGRALVARRLRGRACPSCAPTGCPWALFEPEGGALHARAAVAATIAAFRPRAARWSSAASQPPDGPAGGALGSASSSTTGATLAADAFVFACGPWLPDAVPASPRRADRDPSPGRDAVRRARRAMRASAPDPLPVWIDFEGSFYGFPSFDGGRDQGLPGLARPDRAAGRLGAGRRRGDDRGVADGPPASRSRPSPSQPVVKTLDLLLRGHAGRPLRHRPPPGARRTPGSRAAAPAMRSSTGRSSASTSRRSSPATPPPRRRSRRPTTGSRSGPATPARASGPAAGTRLEAATA